MCIKDGMGRKGPSSLHVDAHNKLSRIFGVPPFSTRKVILGLLRYLPHLMTNYWDCFTSNSSYKVWHGLWTSMPDLKIHHS